MRTFAAGFKRRGLSGLLGPRMGTQAPGAPIAPSIPLISDLTPNITLAASLPFASMTPSSTVRFDDGSYTLAAISNTLGAGLTRPDGSVAIGKIAASSLIPGDVSGDSFIVLRTKSDDRDTSGSYQGRVVVSLTHVGTLAICVTSTPHTIPVGGQCVMRGAVQPEYNGRFAINVVDPVTFNYTMASDPGADATGSLRYTGNQAPNANHIIGGAIRANITYSQNNTVMVQEGDDLFLAMEMVIPAANSFKQMVAFERTVLMQLHDFGLGSGLGPSFAFGVDGGASPNLCKFFLQLGTAHAGSPPSLSSYSTVSAYSETDYVVGTRRKIVIKLHLSHIDGVALTELYIDDVLAISTTLANCFEDFGLPGSHYFMVDQYNYNFIDPLFTGVVWVREFGVRNYTMIKAPYTLYGVPYAVTPHFMYQLLGQAG